MGYTTDFSGTLYFRKELVASEIAYLKSLFGEDRRNHPEWKAPDTFYYVNLMFTPEFNGIKWNGMEKTYGMEDIVNTVIRLMREKFGEFDLEGELHAQGEEIGDVWILRMENGKAVKLPIVLEGKVVRCPHCDEEFILSEEENDNQT